MDLPALVSAASNVLKQIRFVLTIREMIAAVQAVRIAVGFVYVWMEAPALEG